MYEEQLKKLTDPQLRFELYKPSQEHRTVNAFLRAFSHPDDVAESMGELEAYFNGVIAEYDGGDYQKRKVQSEAGRSCKVRLKDFESLNAFVTTTGYLQGGCEHGGQGSGRQPA